jgi:hypothetical protein
MLRPLSLVSLLSFGSLAAVFAVTVATPACTVTELDDDDDDDDDTGEGEGEGGEGEGEGEGEGVPGPEDNDAACADGFDNDDNGFIDCEDFDCSNTEPCSEQNCSDGLDDNNNTFTDCQDFACDFDPACAEDCGNGEDDDGDNRTDCADTVCNGGTDGVRDPACELGAVEIQQIQEDNAVGALAEVNDVFVTSVNVSANGNISMFVQEPDDASPDYPRFAGLGVFVNSGSVATLPGIGDVAPGDCISIAGEVDDFNGVTQLSFLSSFAVADGCGDTVPAAHVVSLVQVATDSDPEAPMAQAGADAEAFEGVLVRVEQVTALGASDNNGFDVVDVDGARLEVSDFLLGAAGPTVADGDAFTSITGVLSQFNAFFQLQPRTLDDIVE